MQSVYGLKKRGVACNHQGQRVGHPHVAVWAETEIVLAADLGTGTDDPRASAPDLLRRALAALPQRARAGGRVAARADAGYFAGQLARAAHDEHICFAIGAWRIAPIWRLLDGISDDDWTDAIEMGDAQVAVPGYRPGWWPANTFLLIRRVRLDPGQVSADPRSRRRRTLHPAPARSADPRARRGRRDLRLLVHPDEPRRVRAGNIFRDGKHGAALRHLPSGYPQVNTAWMWGALLAACMARWLHQLTTATRGEALLAGHGVRGGKAMIETLRRRLISIPSRLVRHTGQPPCGCRPATACSPRSSPACGPSPRCPDHRPPHGAAPGTWNPANPGIKPAPTPETAPAKFRSNPEDQLGALLADSGLTSEHAVTFCSMADQSTVAFDSP